MTDLLGEISRLHLLGVALGAGLGAVCRAAVDRVFLARWGPREIPWATLAVNIAGSFVLGFVLAWTAGAVAGGGPDAEVARTWRLIIGTGFAGGLTTFSTYSVESFQMIREDGPRRSLAYAALTIGLTMLAVLLGDITAAALR